MNKLVEKLYSNPIDSIAIYPNIKFQDLFALIEEKEKKLSNLPKYTRVLFNYLDLFDFISTFFSIIKNNCIAVPYNKNIPNKLYEYHTDVSWDNLNINCENRLTYENVSVILFTSGTSGSPKAVYLTDSNLIYVQDFLSERFSISNKTTSICLSEPYYILGLNVQILTVLLKGGMLYDCYNHNFKKLLAYLDSNIFLSGVPLFYNKLCEIIPATIDINYALIGGAPSTHELISKIEKKISIKPTITYGLTETSPIVTCQISYVKDGVGLPIKDSVIEIIDNEIIVKGPGVAKYIGSELPLATNGIYKTGDLGVIKGGQLFIIGRKKEIINKGGIKISPYLIENYFKKMSTIIECYAGAIFSKKYGEDIGIILLAETELSNIDLKSIPPEYIPKKIIYLKTFPVLESSNKIDRKKLQEILESRN